MNNTIFLLPVRAWLDSHFTGQWIGRGRSAEWLRSADFLYRVGQSGSLKSRPRTLDELEQKIRDILSLFYS
jgi:hypothetical protein